jgi:phospholipase C
VTGASPLLALLPIALLLAAFAVRAPRNKGQIKDRSTDAGGALGIHKIKHVIIIMQENRSFDTYFGTYPGADGIPQKDGKFTVCVPNPASGNCLSPYHNRQDKNGGGPHGTSNAAADVDGGKMDGFVAQVEQARKTCLNPDNPACINSPIPDVMGYHDGRDIPNYWAYARDFVLQDRMFEPNASWSLPAHLFEVSEWSARCSKHDDPSSCVNELQDPGSPPSFLPGFGGAKKNPIYASAGHAGCFDAWHLESAAVF